jgi:hypothetical protein
MLFLIVMTTLAVGMYSSTVMNVQSSANLAHVERARALAESGLRWQAYRFVHMTRPRTLSGKITGGVATGLWPSIKTLINTDYNTLLNAGDRGVTDHGTYVVSKPIAIDGSDDRVVITIDQPFVAADGDAKVRVTSTATVAGATRSASMLFSVTKKVKYAVVGKVPIQLGRNTIVEGPVGMGTANKFPPVLMLSDFMHFDATLRDRITAWNTFLKGSSNVNGVTIKNHNGYDNRISVNNSLEYQSAVAKGYADVNGDAFIDEYDLFLNRFDSDRDGAVSKLEFTKPGTSQLYDANLFAAIDSLGAPMTAGESARLGYQNNMIDNYDGYTKLRGQIAMATTATAWQADSSMAGKKINDMIQGAVAPDDPLVPPVKFGANTDDIFDLSPQNFEQCAANYKNQSGSTAGTTKRATATIENTTISASDISYNTPYVTVSTKGSTTLSVGSVIPKADFDVANSGLPSNKKATSSAAPTTADERTPFGSTSYQATYRRPVFRKVNFKNVIIPKGMNALFQDCTFSGVTFVDMEHDITKSNGTVTYNKDDGMTWSQKMNSGSFSKDTVLNATNSQGFAKGNNIRFDNCTFNGPVAGSYATAYTHFTNSWEFTGATRFDNKVDQTATIVAPQTNMEMGSFTDPTQAPSTLVGVVVAGNIDIRGTSTVDGSVIITGDGAGNTTLAYFGPSDSDTDPGVMPEGGYGRLNIRYNPTRALPDGINLPIDFMPDVASYEEGGA